jgi:NTP pyrophosphatase (non-canonical NTP hydrolase)
MNTQQQVFQAVKARGYLDGWNESQFAARQIAKLTEELGELALLFQFDGYTCWPRLLRQAAREARVAFDDDFEGWLNSGVDLETDLSRFIEEAADVLIPLLCLAEVLQFDLLEAARVKALADVPRGVREEASYECH